MWWLCVALGVVGSEALVSSAGLARARGRGLRAVEEDYATSISEAKSVLLSAAESKGESSDAVVGALLSLEKACRERGRADPSANAQVAAKLDGSWRLVFTTGTIDTQKRTGRVNYFPVKAVQSFDMATNRIANGIFLGDLAALRFFGDFSFDLASKKLQFDFDTLKVFGFSFPLQRRRLPTRGGDGPRLEKQREPRQTRQTPFLQLDRCRRQHRHGSRRWRWPRALEAHRPPPLRLRSWERLINVRSPGAASSHRSLDRSCIDGCTTPRGGNC